jgi:acyl-coenzyme A thioesterase PaaI-like protein
MKITSKQKNSRMCYICGIENEEGLKAKFYNMEDDSVMTKFRYTQNHQSFPNRVHGGLIAAMLDELAFRACWVNDENLYGATMSMEVKYRSPIPYEEDLYGRGIITKNLSKFFESEVGIYDIERRLLANAKVKYIKLPAEKIIDNANLHEEIFFVPDETPILEL